MTSPPSADRAAAKAVEAALDGSFPQVNGVGILLFSVRTLLSDLERYDLGFFVACLCTPLLGPDLARQLPRYRPTALLARETNGDLGLVLPRWRARFAEAVTDADRQASAGSSPAGSSAPDSPWSCPAGAAGPVTSSQAAELFARYYPERAGQMRAAATAGRVPSADPAVLRMLIDDLGPWLAAEYTAVHGEKAPRPGPPA